MPRKGNGGRTCCAQHHQGVDGIDHGLVEGVNHPAHHPHVAAGLLRLDGVTLVKQGLALLVLAFKLVYPRGDAVAVEMRSVLGQLHILHQVGERRALVVVRHIAHIAIPVDDPQDNLGAGNVFGVWAKERSLNASRNGAPGAIAQLVQLSNLLRQNIALLHTQGHALLGQRLLKWGVMRLDAQGGGAMAADKPLHIGHKLEMLVIVQTR